MSTTVYMSVRELEILLLEQALLNFCNSIARKQREVARQHEELANMIAERDRFVNKLENIKR